MGEEDDLNASIAHIVLSCVAGNGLGHFNSKNFTHPGMHANFFIHGVLGFLHYQSGKFNNDFKTAYTISTAATRYLALPCLMADLYREDQGLSTVHLVSGLIPFAMALAGNDNQHLGNLVIACNIVSLCVYSQQRNRVWGYYTAGAGVMAYFSSTQMGKKIAYPLFLALIDYYLDTGDEDLHETSEDDTTLSPPPLPPPSRRAQRAAARSSRRESAMLRAHE